MSKAAKQSSRRQLPKPGCLIPATGHETLAVKRDSHRKDPIGVPFKTPNVGSAWKLPEEDARIATGDESASVRRDRKRFDVTAFELCHQFCCEATLGGGGGGRDEESDDNPGEAFHNSISIKNAGGRQS